MSDDKPCPRCNMPQSVCDAQRPPPVPEAPALPEGEMPDVCVRVEPLVYVPLERLRRVLASQGLRVVDEKDWRVLEAMAALPDPLLTGMRTWPYFAEPIKSELARRGKP